MSSGRPGVCNCRCMLCSWPVSLPQQPVQEVRRESPCSLTAGWQQRLLASCNSLTGVPPCCTALHNLAEWGIIGHLVVNESRVRTPGHPAYSPQLLCKARSQDACTAPWDLLSPYI